MNNLAYRRLPVQVKRRLAEQRRIVDLPPPHRYRCEHCGAGVTAQDAAAHAQRCTVGPRRK